MKKIFLRCVVLLILLSAIVQSQNSNEFVDIDDPRLLEIREHIMRAYYLRPTPLNQCKFEHHKAAVKLYTRVVTVSEQEDAIKDMQTSIIKSEDNYFVGLPETIAALSSSRIKYLIYWESLFINSASYRNPLSGRIVTLHTFFSPSIEITLNYTEPETGQFMELQNCFPFPKWVSRFYKAYVPRLIRLESSTAASSSRNLFVRMSDGVGGKFTEVVKFANNSWLLEVYKSNSIRTSLILRGFNTSENGTSAATTASTVDKPSVNDTALDDQYFEQQAKLYENEDDDARTLEDSVTSD